MEFEEQFPSLEGKDRKGIDEIQEIPTSFYVELDIKKHCLDKQRVKEAIMRLPDDNRRFILLKELGLKVNEEWVKN